MNIFRRAKLPQTFTIFDLKLIIFFIFSVVLVTSDQATDIYAAVNHFKGPFIYYITKMTGCVHKMAVFADILYYIYADIVCGSEKNYADVICIGMVPKEENTHILRI